jgi:hypothetical protein
MPDRAVPRGGEQQRTIHGALIAASATAVQMAPEPGRTVHAAISQTIIAIGLTLRRMLSAIFHRESAESGLGVEPVGPGTRAVNQRSSASRRESTGASVALTSDIASGSRRILRRPSRAGARERPLDEIVTEQRVVGKAPFGRASKDVDVVDAFSRERPFAEQILIDVRHGCRVRIDARVPE